MALCQPVSTNERFPFPSIISHKVSYVRAQMSIIGINVPPTPDLNTPCDDFSRIPIDSWLLWCFNTVLYLWSRFIYYLVLLCYIIYIQSKSYVNVYITLKEMLLKSHEIMLISVNWHLIGYRNIAMICHLPHASHHQINWSEMHWYLTVTHISDCKINSVALNTMPLICNAIRMVCVILLTGQTSSYCKHSCSTQLSCFM